MVVVCSTRKNKISLLGKSQIHKPKPLHTLKTRHTSKVLSKYAVHYVRSRERSVHVHLSCSLSHSDHVGCKVRACTRLKRTATCNSPPPSPNPPRNCQPRVNTQPVLVHSRRICCKIRAGARLRLICNSLPSPTRTRPPPLHTPELAPGSKQLLTNIPPLPLSPPHTVRRNAATVSARNPNRHSTGMPSPFSSSNSTTTTSLANASSSSSGHTWLAE